MNINKASNRNVRINAKKIFGDKTPKNELYLRVNLIRKDTFMDNSKKYMGLNNQPCTAPRYYCTSHQIYLSEEDIKKKKCLCKPSFDMISTSKCNSLLTIEAYEQQKEKRKENIKKIVDSNINNNRTSYLKLNK